MNQKQYHSLEELPLMMNMTDVAAVLGISQSRSVQARPQCRFPGVSDRQAHRCLAGKLPRLAEPAVHRTKMRPSAKSTRYFTVLVVVV